MSLKVISHLIVWSSLVGVGGVLVLTPKDILRQPVISATSSAKPPAAVTKVVEPAIMPATLTVTYAKTGPVNGPSEDLAALSVRAPAVPVSPDEPPVDRRWITAQGLNVRTGPSIEAKHIGSLPFGTEVIVSEMSGKWAYVEAGQLTGWLSSNFLTTEQPDEN